MPGVTLFSRGKVRDVYETDGDHLLIVATDRLSAFDVVMSQGIPDKGRVLTQLSRFWFNLMEDFVPHHYLTAEVADYPQALQTFRDRLEGRSMLVRKAQPFPIECVVRGYLAGSGLKEYRAQGTVCGIKLPEGLTEGSKLGDPIFTPATKAQSGHDENITRDQAAELVGEELLREVEKVTIRLYATAAEHAWRAGIIIADTKFELGLDQDGALVLGDEALTPDSSRFWPGDAYAPVRAAFVEALACAYRAGGLAFARESAIRIAQIGQGNALISGALNRALGFLGYPADEAIGEDMGDLIVPPSLRESHRAGLQRFLDTEHPVILDRRLELTGMNKSGAEFPVELTITRIPWPGCRPSRATCATSPTASGPRNCRPTSPIPTSGRSLRRAAGTDAAGSCRCSTSRRSESSWSRTTARSAGRRSIRS